jgi:hypothetical protein
MLESHNNIKSPKTVDAVQIRTWQHNGKLMLLEAMEKRSTDIIVQTLKFI